MDREARAKLVSWSKQVIRRVYSLIALFLVGVATTPLERAPEPAGGAVACLPVAEVGMRMMCFPLVRARMRKMA